MPHSVSLITTIAASLGLALILGLIADRLRLPALVGYLIAGVLIGPATPETRLLGGMSLPWESGTFQPNAA